MASGYVELLEGVPEVCFHGTLGEEEALGDLTVCPTRGREACYAKLACRQRFDAGEDGLSRAPAGSEEFLPRVVGERGRGGAVGELETLPELVTRLDALTIAAKRCP